MKAEELDNINVRAKMTIPELPDLNPSNMLMEQCMREFRKQEEAAIEKILREYIDNPIVGEITREKVKAAGIRGIVYDADMDGRAFSEIKTEGNNVRLVMTSALLGIAQGHWLIAHNGLRRMLSEKEEAYFRHMEEEDLKAELNLNPELLEQREPNDARINLAES